MEMPQLTYNWHWSLKSKSQEMGIPDDRRRDLWMWFWTPQTMDHLLRCPLLEQVHATTEQKTVFSSGWNTISSMCVDTIRRKIRFQTHFLLCDIRNLNLIAMINLFRWSLSGQSSKHLLNRHFDLHLIDIIHANHFKHSDLFKLKEQNYI